MQNYTVTPATLLQWYNEYNARYFNGELPPATTKNFSVRHYRSRLGAFHHPRIGNRPKPWNISETDYFIQDEQIRRHILLHEMCHAWCFHNGFPREHHGPRWKKKADEISRLSGFKISRLIKGYPALVPVLNKRSIAAALKKNKAYPILVFPYDERNVFIVKIGASSLGKAIHLIGGKYRLETTIKPEGLFLSDAFPKWTVRKGFRRGYLFSRERYEHEIHPLLARGRSFKEPIELFRAAF